MVVWFFIYSAVIFILQSSSYRPYVTQDYTVKFESFSTYYPDSLQIP